MGMTSLLAESSLLSTSKDLTAKRSVSQNSISVLLSSTEEVPAMKCQIRAQALLLGSV